MRSTSDFVTSELSPSIASNSSRPAATPTATAAGRSKSPTNTESHCSNDCSYGSSSAYDQSIAAWSVWCRSTASWLRVARSRNRWSRRARISEGDITVVRAAASSIARALPSRCAQRSATAAAFSSVTRERASGVTRPADEQRTRFRFLDGERRGVDGQLECRQRIDPLTMDAECLPAGREHRQLRRLLRLSPHEGAHRRQAGARSCRVRAAGACAGRTRRGLRPVETPWDGVYPNAAATASGTNSGSRTPASSHHHTPSAYSDRSSAPTRNARRVLPAPPTPTIDTTRLSPSAFTTATTSSPRPTKVLSSPGRFDRSASCDVSGGKLDSRPGASTWNTRTDDSTSRSRCRPRSSTSYRSPASSATRPLQTIWPPCAIPISLAAWFTAGP